MKPFSFIFFVLLITTSCSSIVETSDTGSSVGLRYALPLDQLRITVVTNTDYADKLEFLPGKAIDVNVKYTVANASVYEPTPDQILNFYKMCYIVPDKKVTGKITDITKVQISDWSGGYSVNINPGYLNNTDVTFSRNELGYLTSADIKSDGKAGDTIISTAKLAATVTGFALSGPAGAIGVDSVLDMSSKARNSMMYAVNKSNEFLDKSATQYKETPSGIESIGCAELRFQLVQALDIETLVNTFDDKYIEIALLTAKLEKSLFENVTQLKSALGTTDQSLARIAIEIANAKSYDDIAKLEKEREAHAINKTRLESRADYYATEIEIGKDAVRKLFIIKKDESKTDIVDVAINDLMHKTNKTTVITPADIDDEVVLKDIFAQAKVGVTASLATEKKSVNIAMPKENNTAHIAYRDPETVVLTFYNYDKQWQPVKKTVQQLITSTSPVGMIPYDASAWSKRNMTLSWSKGLLTTVNYVSESDADAIATSMSDAADGYISKVTTAQKARLDIQAASRTAALEQLQFEMDTLDKQKTILENKQSLALLNTAEAVELSKIQQQILLLQQRKVLLDAQTDLTVAEITQQDGINTAQYNSQLEALKAQLALQTQQDGNVNIATQIMLIKLIADLEQGLVDNPDAEALRTEIQKLKIDYAVLQKELQLKGLLSTPIP